MSETDRNSPCPCGSGLKYKKCCLGRDLVDPTAQESVWTKKSRGREQDHQIDRFIIQGQKFMGQQDLVGACEIWARVWDHFLLRLSPSMTSCELSLTEYDGSFFLSNWLQDYCAVLHRLALQDEVRAQAGVAFCEQVLDQFPAEDELLIENFRASLGEFHFLAGESEAGDAVLTRLITECPDRAAGYACLAQMLGETDFNPGKDHPHDLPRAISLLEAGLAFPAMDAGDYDLERRLEELRKRRKE